MNPYKSCKNATQPLNLQKQETMSNYSLGKKYLMQKGKHYNDLHTHTHIKLPSNSLLV